MKLMVLDGNSIVNRAFYGVSQNLTTRDGQPTNAIFGFLNILNKLVEEGQLSAGHARTLIPLSPDMQEKLAETIIKNDLSVRQTEALVKKFGKEPKKAPSPEEMLSVNYTEAAAHELTEHLGRSCRIVSGKKKGRLEIEYYGVDDLNDLLDALHTLRRKSGGKA